MHAAAKPPQGIRSLVLICHPERGEGSAVCLHREQQIPRRFAPRNDKAKAYFHFTDVIPNEVRDLASV
jgi:hypothetical protein